MSSITATGVETRVNVSTNQNQSQAVVTALANGQYVVVWVDYLLDGNISLITYANADIKARIFNADGTPATSEFIVNATTAAAQWAPSVTTLTDGHFLVAWQDGIGNLIGGAGAPLATVRAQEFTATGAPVGGEFSLGSSAQSYLPTVAALAGGGFVATWQAGTAGAYVAQVYDSNNAPVGSQFTVDSTNTGTFGRVLAAGLANGNIAFAWTNGVNEAAISTRVFTTAGVGVTDQLVLGQPNGAYNSAATSIVALASGGYAVGWVTNSTTFNSSAAYLFMSDPTNTLTTSEQLAFNPGANNSITNARLTALQDGGVVATWNDGGQLSDGSAASIRYAQYSPIGILTSSVGQVNATATGNQGLPAAATLSDGDVIFVWTDPSGSLGDTSGSAIHARRYDFNAANRAPTAINDQFVATGVGEGYPASYLTDNDTDPDGDPLIVTAISNVTGGTVFFDFAQQGFDFTRTNPNNIVEFDYTVSDGNGGVSTAHARLLPDPSDNVVVRGVNATIDFLANDYLPSRPEGYSFSLSNTSNSNFVGYFLNSGVTGTSIIVSVGYSPGTPGTYAFLPVGQTQQQTIFYDIFNPVTGLREGGSFINITLQGWAQTGGTGYDELIGGAQSDHLIGGNGAANALIGGAGDDWYTSTAVGDSIIELPGGGIDTVWTSNVVFTLPANVERLIYMGATGAPSVPFLGIGNAENNQLVGGNARDELYGGAGNDFLQGGGGGDGQENTLFGGTGDDTYTVGVRGDSTIEYANEGIDTVRTTFSIYGLQANIENLTLTNTAAHQAAVGNELNNIITGNTGADDIFGRAGNDTLNGGTGTANTLLGQEGDDIYNVQAVGDSVIEFVGEGQDTVNAATASFTLSANVEDLTFTGTGAFIGVGNELANAITGGAGADSLNGLDGNDRITGGSGADLLQGGAGADQFRYNGGETGLDRILDFVSGTDKIALNGTNFAHTAVIGFVQGAGATALAAVSTFLLDTNTGIVSYDADGTGAGAAVQIAQINFGQTLAAGDFIFV